MEVREFTFYAYGQTVINPIALIFTLSMGILMVVVPRRYVIIPMLLASTFITEWQRIHVAGMDFNMMRILTIFGWVRLVFRKETRGYSPNKIDVAIILFSVSNIILNTLLWGEWRAFVNRLGAAFNIVGMYFLFRLLIKDSEDIDVAISALLLLLVPLSVLMFMEHHTGRNLFSIFGGVAEHTQIREGRLRCQGPFMVSILAGTFAATLVPLCLASIVGAGSKLRRLVAVVELFSALAMTALSASSGPVMSLAGALAAVAFWPFRRNMREVRLVGITLLAALQVKMKAPVWSLVGRFDSVPGSTGDHRFMLLDQFIRRFGEWFLVGVKTTAYWGWGLQDVTNQFVLIGTQGGVLTLTFFILVLVRCFKSVGTSLRASMGQKRQFMTWCLGCVLFAHVVSFFGISYFDQINVSWYLLLSMIATRGELYTLSAPFARRSVQIPA